MLNQLSNKLRASYISIIHKRNSFNRGIMQNHSEKAAEIM